MAKPHPYVVNTAYPGTWGSHTNFGLIGLSISFWCDNFLYVWHDKSTPLIAPHVNNAHLVLGEHMPNSILFGARIWPVGLVTCIQTYMHLYLYTYTHTHSCTHTIYYIFWFVSVCACVLVQPSVSNPWPKRPKFGMRSPSNRVSNNNLMWLS